MNKIYIFGIGILLAMLLVFTAPAAAHSVYFEPQHSSASTGNSTYVKVYLDLDEGETLLAGQLEIMFDNETADITRISKKPDEPDNYSWNNFWQNLDYSENGYAWNGVADPFCEWDEEEGEWSLCSDGLIHGPAHVKICRYKIEAVGTPGTTALVFGDEMFPDACWVCQRCKFCNRTGEALDITWVNGTFTHEGVGPQTYTISGYTDPAADTVKITNMDKPDVVDDRPVDYIDTVTGFYNLTLDVSSEVVAGNELRIHACEALLDEEESNCNDTFHIVVNAPGEDTNVNLTLDHYCLDLTGFPMYEAEEVGDPADHNKGCGPAVAKMWLDYMHNSTTQWNNTSFGDMPAKDQAELYDWGIGNNSNITHPYFDTEGMWHTVQYLDPIYLEYGYNFGKYSSTDQDYMMKQICRWISYAPGDQPGHPVHVPGAVPAYGNYENWMAVRGIHTSEDAYPLPADLLVYGLWVNDPYPASLGGIGENSYKTAAEWKTTYYLPLDVPGEETYNGKYVGILEPPGDDDGEITIVPAKPRFADEITPALAEKALMVYDVEQLALEKVVNNDESLKIVAAAIDGVSEELLPYDAGFAEAFAKTTAGSPMLVSSDNGDYYLVPFNKPVMERPPVKIMPVKIEKIKKSGLMRLERLKRVDGNVIIEPIPINPINLDRTLVVVVVDADDGSFKEASWVTDPVKYLPVSKVEALKLALGEVDVTDGDGLSTLSSKPEIELVYKDASPYYPAWKVTIGEDIHFVNQDGTVSS